MTDTLCQGCQRLIAAQKQELPTAPKISLGFLYQLALELQFSFQAIALMADFAIERRARKFHIKLLKVNELTSEENKEPEYDENVVEVKFDGHCLNQEEAMNLGKGAFSNFRGGMELVLSMFGIGRSGLILSNNGESKSVILFSVDDRINPNYFLDESGMYYTEDLATKTISNFNGTVMKRVIYQSLRLFHPDPDKILDCPTNTTKIVVFHPKIFITSSKLMFYQIRESNLGHDIDTHYNSQRIEFLNKLGYEMSIHAQFRLSCYFSCLYLKLPFNISIGESETPIYKSTYIDYLETLRKNNVLVKLTDVRINGCSRVDLFETTDKYFMQNNGILLYWNGRMINRFETEFGRMIDDKFYKRKYRTPPRNIWPIVGVIEVDKTKFGPNIVRNRLKDSFEYKRLVKDIYLLVFNLQSKNKAIVIENQSSDQYRPKDESYPRKRVKVDHSDHHDAKERERDHREKEIEREREKQKERERQRQKEKQRQREKEADREREREKEKTKDRQRERLKEKQKQRQKEREREKDKQRRRQRQILREKRKEAEKESNLKQKQVDQFPERSLEEELMKKLFDQKAQKGRKNHQLVRQEQLNKESPKLQKQHMKNPEAEDKQQQSSDKMQVQIQQIIQNKSEPYQVEDLDAPHQVKQVKASEEPHQAQAMSENDRAEPNSGQNSNQKKGQDIIESIAENKNQSIKQSEVRNQEREYGEVSSESQDQSAQQNSGEPEPDMGEPLE